MLAIYMAGSESDVDNTESVKDHSVDSDCVAGKNVELERKITPPKGKHSKKKGLSTKKPASHGGEGTTAPLGGDVSSPKDKESQEAMQMEENSGSFVLTLKSPHKKSRAKKGFGVMVC